MTPTLLSQRPFILHPQYFTINKYNYNEQKGYTTKEHFKRKPRIPYTPPPPQKKGEILRL